MDIEDGKLEAKQFAYQVWVSMRPEDRSIRKVEAECLRLGRKVSRSNIQRWSVEWDKAVPRIQLLTEVIEPTFEMPALANGRTPGQDLADAVRDVIDPRLNPLIELEDINSMLSDVRKASNSLVAQFDAIVEEMVHGEAETETITRENGVETTKRVKKQPPRDAIAAIAQLAGAANVLMTAKATYTNGHARLGQGDMMAGQGRKANAKANVITNDGRADAAKVIDGTSETIDDDGKRALEALRGRAK